MKIAIIDDEKKSRENMRSLLEKYLLDIQIVGEASSAEAGEALINSQRPDLILLDVEMPKASGFDLVQRFPNPEFNIIFCTAHDHYAIPAIRCAAIDYLLKPINIMELQAAINRARNLHARTPQRSQQVATLLGRLPGKQGKQKLAVPDQKGISFYETNEIIFLEAQSNYTEILLRSGRKITSSKTLKDYEEMLSEDHFFRVSKSHLINLNMVNRYEKGTGGQVLMEGRHTITVARRRKEELLNLLYQT